MVCLFLHYLAVTIVKIVLAHGFKSTHNLPGKVFHVLNHLYCPSIYKDWDEDLLVCSDIEENWTRVKKEMKCLLFLFALENVLLCTPLFILSSMIAKRNLYLDEYFPQVLEESQATVLVYFFNSHIREFADKKTAYNEGRLYLKPCFDSFNCR